MALPQRVSEGVAPRREAVRGVRHQLRQRNDRRRNGRRAQPPGQPEPLQPRAAHKHQHRADGQDQQRAGQVRLQQHEHRDDAQNQCKRHNACGKRLHPVVIQ